MTHSNDSPFTEISPANTIFAFVALEGPDRYSLAGGLGVRVTELSEALAHAGYETHLFFIGAPDAPAHEITEDGRHLWRCCQGMAAHFAAGVYDGVEEKILEFERRVPPLLLSHVARKAHAAGQLLVILGEDWHTAATIAAIS
nr:glycosyl transferase family 1 [Geodermatophilaceae bacterium]